jgi:phosphate transport system permease protein
MSTLFAGPPYGIGVLTASVILTVMILPLTASISREALETAPPLLRESAYALGCTPSEVVGKFMIPHARVALTGAVLLALGRALGETMAVAFVIGNVHKISASLLAPGTTIPATIANELPDAVGDLYVSSLIALG